MKRASRPSQTFTYQQSKNTSANEKEYVRVDMPYPMQHYITLPNIERMGYTSAFVGQVSEIQMPYNVNSTDLGIVTYWDFTN